MAADPTRNDTENPPDEVAKSSSSLLAAGPGGGPPRPPRPATKRNSSSRIPIPMPAPRSPDSTDSFEALGADSADASDAAPPRPLRDDGELPSAPFPLSSPAVATPVPARGSAYVEEALPSDRAPAAPLTPWGNVPPLRLREDLESDTPPPVPTPRRQIDSELDSSPPVGIDENEEHEDTIVGEVPKNLLELSSAGDENTRAYTAPQELIELARRKREEREQARAGRLAQPRVESAAPPVIDQNAMATERPPMMKRREEAAKSARKVQASAVESLPPLSDGDSAPPVRRVREPVESRSGRPVGSAPIVEVSPASDVGSVPSSLLGADAAPRVDVPPESALPASEVKAPWYSTNRWLVVALVFVLLGYALARWGVLFG